MKAFFNQLSHPLSRQLLSTSVIAPPPFDSGGRPKGRGRARWLGTVLFIMSLLISSRTSHATAITWTNVSGGNWSTATNWSPNQVPISTDDAFITNVGTYTVTLDASPTVNSLTLGGDGGQKTLSTAGYILTLNHASVVTNNGIMALNGGALGGGGVLTVAGQLAWSGGQINVGPTITVATNGIFTLAGVNGNSYYLGCPLNNAGTVQLVSGNLTLNGIANGVLVNLPGGFVELTADLSIAPFGGGPGFSNQGTLVKSGGTGVSTISVPFSNSGTVEANTGIISINAGATLGTGSLFIGAGQTQLAGGTVSLNGNMTSSNLVLAGGYFEANGVLNGVLIWTGGQLGTAKVSLTISTNSTLVLAGVNGASYYMGQYLTNEGTIILQGGNLALNWTAYGTLANLPGGVVDFATDASIQDYGGGPGFNNQGTVLKSGGTDTSTISTAFNNSGTVEVNTGVISINSSYSVILTTGSQFIGAGQTQLTGGTFSLNGSMTSSNLVLAGGYFEGNGVLNGVLTWTGGQLGTSDVSLTIATNSTLVLAGVNGASYYMGQYLTNEGTIVLQGGNLALNWAGGWGALVNLPGGVLNIAADASIQAYGGGPGFNNQGSVLKSGGANTSTISTAFNNSGTVEVNTGVININSGYSVILATGSRFIGAGQITLTGGTANLNGSVTSSNLVLAGGYFEGSGVLNGLLTWTGGQLGTANLTLTIASNATLVLAGVNDGNYYLGQHLNNEGTIHLQSGNLLLNWAGAWGSLVNLPGGVVDFAADTSIQPFGTGPGFNNQGTVLKSGGTNTSTISTAFNNSGGSVSVECGTISLSGNNFAQGGGTLAVTLGGTNSGQSGDLADVNSAALAGLLTVNLTNGFVPAPGSTIQILSCSSLSGTLGPLNVPSGLSVSYSNNGVYVTVTNTLALAPAITVQPATNVTLPYAGSAAFSVAATGMTPLSYQWTLNSKPLSDGGPYSGSATANLALNGVTDNNAGSYTVVITNAYGSVTSAVATLTVLNCTAPPSGLIAWWPGNGNALDIVGGNNGVLSSGVTFAPGEVGPAFSFNGSNQSVIVPDSPSLGANQLHHHRSLGQSRHFDRRPERTRSRHRLQGGVALTGNFGYQLWIPASGALSAVQQPRTGMAAMDRQLADHSQPRHGRLDACSLYLRPKYHAPLSERAAHRHQCHWRPTHCHVRIPPARISGDDNGNGMFDGFD
jgi:hypothetical protein